VIFGIVATMPTTRIQTDIGLKDNGCIVVSLLSAPAQQAIIRLQTALTTQLGDILWTMPAASLHATLCEIIQPKPYSEDKKLLYERNHTEYEIALEEVLSHYEPISVRFDTIEASEQTIIIRGDDGGVFNQIRAELIEKLPFPAETKLPPNIVHSSIARYTEEVDLENVRAIVERLNISFTETIYEFQFMYPIWPHLLHYDVVRRYQLGGK
jgi:hypothetical protein